LVEAGHQAVALVLEHLGLDRFAMSFQVRDFGVDFIEALLNGHLFFRRGRELKGVDFGLQSFEPPLGRIAAGQSQAAGESEQQAKVEFAHRLKADKISPRMANFNFKDYQVVTSRPEDTEAVGAQFALTLTAPDCVVLSGPLGAGKTHFVKGMVRALGGGEEASSPTFALVHEYSTQPALLHFDLHRLQNEDEIWALGFEDHLREKAILVMEWGEKFPAVLPSVRWVVDFSLRPGDQRLLTFRRYE